MAIALLFVFFVVGLLGVYLLVSWYIRYVYKTLVTDKIVAIENVMETGDVPQKWKSKLASYLLKRTEGTFFHTIGGFVMKKRYTHKLIRLIDYLEHSTHLPAEDKESYVLVLEEILKDWNGRNIKQLL